MARVLVEHGADATAQDKPGQMRVDSAAACGILKWSTWTWHGSSSSTAPMPQPRTEAGRLRCLRRPRGVHLVLA
jgi:hypothetical protein